ncbi:MAG TPA: rod shape-determining protein [Candidatus Woesebacteria bacterium]|nr:rod shape-determining protein [Candidatus Woesebacteria bacterium]HPJ17226.1 rod shape-determining protein [Candidatus Woesebacteria bacterium]
MLFLSQTKNRIEDWWKKFSWDIGIDLGTSNTVVYLKDRGVVIDEPTLLARIKKKRWLGLSAPKHKVVVPLAYGIKAKEMMDREPIGVEVVSPIKNGIVSDLEALESLLAYYLKMVYEIPSGRPKIFKPQIVISVPCLITDVQKRAVRSVLNSLGAKKVILIEGLVLAGVGMGMPTDRSAGLMMVDMGGGKTEVGLVSQGGVVITKGIKVGGDDLDLAIVNYLKMKYGILIGKNSAEKIKIDIGSVWDSGKENKTVLVRGRDLETGLPKSLRVNEVEIREALSLLFNKMVKLVKEVVDEVPPEMIDDVIKRGIILGGNGAKIKGMAKLIENDLKIATKVADEPGKIITQGLVRLIDDQEKFKTVKIYSGQR